MELPDRPGRLYKIENVWGATVRTPIHSKGLGWAGKAQAPRMKRARLQMPGKSFLPPDSPRRGPFRLRIALENSRESIVLRYESKVLNGSLLGLLGAVEE